MSSGAATTTVPSEVANPLRLFAPIANRPGSIWLDSSLHFGDRGHFSFIARNPSLDVCLHKGEITASHGGEAARIDSKVNILDYLEKLWRSETRFAVGYVSYEAATSFLSEEDKKQALPIKQAPSVKQAVPINQALPVPEMRFLFYDSVVRFDHVKGVITITNPSYDDYSDLFGSHTADSIEDDIESSVVMPTLSKAEYLDKIDRIKWHIAEGDVYQVNFTVRFDTHSQSDPFVTYKRLRHLNPSPYGAFLNFGDYQILSSSPERMFKKAADHITTSPIKGTVRRGRNQLEETANLQRLLDSEKDRAELLMIVDLERNDLGKIAQIGSVKVDELFKPEIYSSLIHLVSDISAELRPEAGLTDIFRALLPGGSITGAPKKRAVEIISQLEATPRSVYTGCIGYVDGDQADFNIAIRTILHQEDTYCVHAGGGIVADSDPEVEYREMLLKAGNLFKALGTNLGRVAP